MDLEESIKSYSNKNGYPISKFEPLICSCGQKEFLLYSDDDEGGAFVICSECGLEYDIENSKKYIENAVHNICNCDNEKLNIGIGKAFYKDAQDIRWLYVGAKCNECELAGVYVDWQER